MTDPSLEMGPLPKRDHNDELQQQSLSALRSVIPTDRFLLRDERYDDKGVDASLELIAQSGFTNIRSQIQLKATEDNQLNKDGSFSLSVSVSNLNYLLNGPSPLYIVWLSTRREFRYAWAREEAHRLFNDTPKWLEQNTVTLHFRNSILPQKWNIIYDRIKSEGQLHRLTHDRLAQTASIEPITLRIDSSTLRPTTDQQAYKWLTESGLSLIAAGYARQVHSLVRMLPDSQINESRIRLVSGYASYTIGDYFSARGDLGRAAGERDVFKPVDRFMLDALLIDCDYCLGRIDNEQMRIRQLQVETEAPEPIALQLRLDRIRWRHIGERNLTVRNELASELREIVERIISDPSISDSLKLRARITRLYAEAADTNIEHIHAIALLRARIDVGIDLCSMNLPVQLQEAFAKEMKIDQESDACVKLAVDQQHPLLIAEALLNRAIILVVRLSSARMLTSKQGQITYTPSKETVQTGLEQLIQAEKYFRVAGSDEGVVRAVLLQADWLTACGQESDAISRVQSVVALANGLGLQRHIHRISEHQTKNTEHHQLLKWASNPPDQIASMANRSDEEILSMATMSLETLGLPSQRLPILQRECFSWRAIAKEKMQWCQHLELIQDLRHELSSETHFRSDPERMCSCTLHKFKSTIPSVDWDILLVSFKASRCSDCKDRSPRKDVVAENC